MKRSIDIDNLVKKGPRILFVGPEPFYDLSSSITLAKLTGEVCTAEKIEILGESLDGDPS